MFVQTVGGNVCLVGKAVMFFCLNQWLAMVNAIGRRRSRSKSKK